MREACPAWLYGLLSAGVCALAGFIAAAEPARAQADVVLGAVPAAYRADYARTLDNPGDLALIYRLALRMEQDGLYAEAARLYERGLLVEEDATARLRLAVLAERLGNPAAALAHLDRIPPGALSPDEQRAARLLRDEAEDARRRHRLDGVVVAGLRYNTNAAAAPYEIDPLQSPLLEAGDEREPGYSLFADFALSHRFDPQLQSALTYDTELLVSAEKQFEFDEFDGFYALATTGPSVPLDPGRDRMVLRPFLLGELYVIGGDLYYAAPGAGIEFLDRPRPQLDVAVRVEAQYNYYGSAAEVEAPTGLAPSVRRLTNQVRHRLCPGPPWERDTATSALRRDAVCAG
jgi:tetratricopeptide (TPR) repeat protein